MQVVALDSALDSCCARVAGDDLLVLSLVANYPVRNGTKTHCIGGLGYPRVHLLCHSLSDRTSAGYRIKKKRTQNHKHTPKQQHDIGISEALRSGGDTGCRHRAWA